jgi:flagellar biosynthetic protein FliR
VTATWVTAFLVFARMSALMWGLPVIATKGMPKYVGVLLSVALTVLIAPGVPLVAGEPTLGVLVLGLASEILLGASLGLVVRGVFSSFTVAAEMLSRQTALGMSSMLDPVMSASQSPLGVIASWVAGLVFLLSNLHLAVIVTVAGSFDAVPPGHLVSPIPLANAVVDAVEIALIVGVQLSGPLVALVFLVNVFIGILGRLAPRMNVFFSVGMTVNSVVGIWLFGVALPWMLQTHGHHLRDAIRTVASLILQVG